MSGNCRGFEGTEVCYGGVCIAGFCRPGQVGFLWKEKRREDSDISPIRHSSHDIFPSYWNDECPAVDNTNGIHSALHPGPSPQLGGNVSPETASGLRNLEDFKSSSTRTISTHDDTPAHSSIVGEREETRSFLEHGHFHLHNDAHIFFVSPSTLSVP